MAQLDTGLGWSAEEGWLKYTQGTVLASLEGMTTSLDAAQPIPTVNNASELWSKGRMVATRGAFNYYVAAQAGTLGVAAVQSGTDVHYVEFLTPTREYTFYVGQTQNGQPGNIDTVTPTSITPHYKIWDYIDGVPIYYNRGVAIYIGESESINLPICSIQTLFESITLADSAVFTKDTDGYAVACIAKWKTGAGAVITTPILISTDTEYTDMSASGGNYNLAKLNILHLGIRFYMSFWDIADGSSIISALPVFDMTEPGDPALTLENVFKFIASVSYAHITVPTAPDPYENEGEESQEDGGDGEETEDDEHGIEVGSDFPSAINTGFCRIFTPSESELQNLSNYLWSNSYDIAQVKKLFSNPMDSVLGLSAVPIRLLGSSVSFSLGGVPVTGMTLPLVTKQRYTYQMGYVDVAERWGSYLDYDPYTKFSIFLPFIGMRELATDDIMGKRVILVYDFDILSGTCVARLQAGKNCLYEWGGVCALQLPINSRNWDSVFNTAVGAVGGIVSAASGGSAPLVAGSVASAALSTVSMKPRIDKSGNINGAAGWLGQMRPYLIRTTPEAYIPGDQNRYIGYPSYISVALSSLVGYNEIESVHLHNIPATGEELTELESILKSGVIF